MMGGTSGLFCTNCKHFSMNPADYAANRLGVETEIKYYCKHNFLQGKEAYLKRIKN